MGIFDWIADKIPSSGPDVPSWLAERGSNIASLTEPATSRIGGLGDAAKTIGQFAFDPRYDPLLRGIYEAGSAAKEHIPGLSGGGGGSTPAAATPDNKPKTPTSPIPNIDFKYLVNPLAANMFYSQTIAPLLNQMADKYQGQLKEWNSGAQQALNQFQMPAEFRAHFAGERPEMMTNQLNLTTALRGAALQQPAYDTLMKRLGDISTATQSIAAKQAAQQALISAMNSTSTSGGSDAFLKSLGINTGP